MPQSLAVTMEITQMLKQGAIVLEQLRLDLPNGEHHVEKNNQN